MVAYILCFLTPLSDIYGSDTDSSWAEAGLRSILAQPLHADSFFWMRPVIMKYTYVNNSLLALTTFII